MARVSGTQIKRHTSWAGQQGTQRRLAISAILLLLLSMLVQYASFAAAPTVLAAHDEGIFELDGDALDDTDSDFPDDADWEDGPEGAADSFFAGAATEAAANDNTYFTTGGSKDENDIPSWEITTTGAPDKNELLDAYAAVYLVGGETWVYFGADRFDNDGTAQIGFWFFQDEIGIAAGDFTGNHVDGDVLIISEYTNGGVVSTICAYVWDADDDGDNIDTGDVECDEATNGSNLDLVAAGAACDVPGGDGSFEICAVSNSADTDAPWPFLNKDNETDFGPGQFFEGGLNLSDMFGGDAPCFGTFLAETRTSAETDAQLKDFALGDFNTCVPPDLETDSSVSDADFGDEVTDLATLDGTMGPVEGEITFFICAPEEVDVPGDGCPDGEGTQVGDPVEIDDNEQAESEAYTVGLTADAVGTYCWRAEYTPADDSDYLATSHSNDTTECFEVGEADIDVDKTADAASVSAGEGIGFTVTLSNTGVNTALGIDFEDNLPGGPGVSWSINPPNADWSITGAAPNQVLNFIPTSLAGGATSTVHVVSSTTPASCATYDNTATVSSTSDGEDSASASVQVKCPDVRVTKEPDEGDPGNDVEVGGVATFTITVTNDGPGAAKGVTLTDELPDGIDWTDDSGQCTITPDVGTVDQVLSCSFGELADDAIASVTLTGTTDSGDCGTLNNTASVAATNEATAQQANNADSGEIDVLCPALSIVKVDDIASYDSVGDVISYTITATNIGNVALTNVVVTDPNVSDLDCTPDIPVPSLAPGAQIVCTASHTVTQEDLDNGSFLNAACVDDGGGDGDTFADEVCDDEDTPGEQNPLLQIVKVDDIASYDSVGDVINYTITVTNIGNVTLDGVVVTDEQVSDLVCVPATPVDDFAPGDEITCTASHTVTQEDLDNGSFLNTACADDGEGDGTEGAAEVCDDEDTPGEQNPLLQIVKSDGDATYDEIGDVINYTIVVTNIGNVTLDDVDVTDPNVSDLLCVPGTPVDDFAPGDMITCTASHTVTQEDLDNGSFLNTACADDGEGGADEVCDDEDTPGEQNPLLAITKDVAEVEFTAVGQVLHYTIVATNIGNITLHDVVVTDEQVTDLDCTPDTPVDLAPGASITCTASHTIVQADLDAGFFFNQACADDGNGDGDTGAAEVCDDVTTPGQQAGGETDAPSEPPTDSKVGGGNAGPANGAWLLLVGLAIALTAFVMVTPQRGRKPR